MRLTLLQSPGCPYCQRLSAIWSQVVEKLRADYPDLQHTSHNLDTDGPHPLLKPNAGVPQVAIEVDGKHVETLIGYRPADAMVMGINEAVLKLNHSGGTAPAVAPGGYTAHGWTMWWAMVSLLTIIVAFIMWVYSSVSLNGMLKLESTAGNPELKTAADFGTATAALLAFPLINVLLASLFTARTADLLAE